MNDIVRHYQRGPVSYRLRVRVSDANGWVTRWTLPYLWKWFVGNCPWFAPFGFRLTNHANSSDCYCPEGRSQHLHLHLFGFYLNVWITADWVPKLCHCDKVMWLLFPSNHESDIELYGEAKLRAEYPGVESLEAA